MGSTESDQQKSTEWSIEDRVKIWDTSIKTVGLLGVLITAVLGILKFRSEENQKLRDEARRLQDQVAAIELREKAAVKESEKAIRDAKKEFNKALYELRRPMFEKVCRSAAGIANAEDLAGVGSDIDNFWRMYLGELCLVEDDQVKLAMVAFGKQLGAQVNGKPPRELWGLALDLSAACRMCLDIEGVFDPLTKESREAPKPGKVAQ
jgi:regulator of replication initiation timing